MVEHSIFRALQKKQMVICIGPGGAGKTTLSAAMALAAANGGRRVACLSIDPARRLADALGVSDLAADGQVKDVSYLLSEQQGRLFFGMLDARQSFDALIREGRSVQGAERILKNRLYRYVSSSLSGMQEYMALEYLCRLHESGRFELVVLDTPPAGSATAFFSAAARIGNALDGPLVRTMQRMYHRSGQNVDRMGRWSRSVFDVLRRMTGSELLDDMAEFIDAMSSLFGSFHDRASRLEALLRSPEVEITMVAQPDRASLRELTQLRESLTHGGFHIDGVLFNRCHQPPVPDIPEHALPEDGRCAMGALNARWNQHARREHALMASFQNEHVVDYVCTLPFCIGTEEGAAGLKHLWNNVSLFVGQGDAGDSPSGVFAD